MILYAVKSGRQRNGAIGMHALYRCLPDAVNKAHELAKFYGKRMYVVILKS